MRGESLNRHWRWPEPTIVNRTEVTSVNISTQYHSHIPEHHKKQIFQQMGVVEVAHRREELHTHIAPRRKVKTKMSTMLEGGSVKSDQPPRLSN